MRHFPFYTAFSHRCRYLKVKQKVTLDKSPGLKTNRIPETDKNLNGNCLKDDAYIESSSCHEQIQVFLNIFYLEKILLRAGTKTKKNKKSPYFEKDKLKH